MSRAWYVYKRGNADITLPESYIYSSVKPTCLNGRIICAIYAIYAGQNPATISNNLQTYAGNGQSSGLAQPSSPLGAKKYVYLLPS